MTHRKLQALRNLAERPGTPAEGILARELLKRYETTVPDDESDLWTILGRHARGECSTDEFIGALRRYREGELLKPLPTRWRCACGVESSVGAKCENVIGHLAIQTEIRGRFSKGDRVFYNYRCYAPNYPATVTGYVRLTPENGTHPWAWISVKFTHLKNARQVPIYSVAGWHLSKDALPPDECERLIHAK